MKRIVIVGDSLGMPRPGVALEDTYPYRLQKLLPECEVYSKHRRANDSATQSQPINLRDDIEYMKADIIVFHLGIVDCAPRLFSRSFQKTLWKLKVINKYIISFMSKRRLFFTRVCPKVYVKPVNFKTNIKTLIQAATQSASRVLLITIAETNTQNLDKSYGFADNIQQYNKILSDLAATTDTELVDINKLNTEEILTSDGIHLNIPGNLLLATTLAKLCSK